MKRWKQCAAFAITSCMIFTAMPMSTFAYEEADTQQESTTEEIATEEMTTQEEILTEESTVQDEVIVEEATTQEEVIEEETTAQEVTTESEEKKTSASDFQDTEEIINPIIFHEVCGAKAFWHYEIGTDTLYITGQGEMNGYGQDKDDRAPWYEYRDDIKHIVIESGITKIGENDFLEMRQVTSVEFPDTLTEIDTAAFCDCPLLTPLNIPYGVKRIGYAAFAGATSLESVVIPDSVTELEGCFGTCPNLKSVTLPKNLTKIGWGMFTGDSALTSLQIPESVTVFEYFCFAGCTSLSDINIPKELTTIEKAALSETPLTSITLPENVTAIDEEAFFNCSNLEEVTILSPKYNIAEYAFGYGGTRGAAAYEKVDSFRLKAYRGTQAESYAKEHGFTFIDLEADKENHKCGDQLFWEYDQNTKTLTISGSGKMWDYRTKQVQDPVTGNEYYTTAPWSSLDFEKVEMLSGESVGEKAFYGCKNLKKVNLSDSVITLGEEAFRGCTALESVHLSKGIKEISDRAFMWDESLKDINLENIEAIGQYAFYSASALKKVTFSSALKRIDDSSFKDSGLTEVYLPDSLETIGNGVFSGSENLKTVRLPNKITKIPDEMFVKTAIESMEIPDSVTEIGRSAFTQCSKLKKIRMPDNVICIGEWAFGSCGIQEITLSKKLEKIGSAAFWNDEKLAKITIPASVKEIESSAFLYCNGLTEITILNKTVKLDETGIGDVQSGSEGILEKLVIKGYTGSTAEKYAKEKKLTFYALDKAERIKKEIISITSATPVKNGMKLIWSTSANADTYTIYRKTGSGKYSTIGSISSQKLLSLRTPYVDTKVKSGTSYTYKVIASYKGVNSATKEKTAYYLSEPAITLKSGTSGVTVSWNKVTGASDYYIYRKVSGGRYVKVITVKTTSYLDKKATAGKINVYKVIAHRISPNALSSYTEKQILYLTSTKLTLSRKSSKATSVTLKWTKVTGAKGYYIYRKTGKGSYKKIADIKKATTLKYTDKSVKKGIKYTYAVRAYNGKVIAPYTPKTK